MKNRKLKLGMILAVACALATTGDAAEVNAISVAELAAYKDKIKIGTDSSGRTTITPLSKEGHGGQSVVCRNEDGSIKSAELLDFFEARVMYGLEIPNKEDSVDELVNQSIKKFSAAMDLASSGNTYWKYLFNSVKNAIRPLNEGKLTPIDDSFPVVLPKNCKIEQLAIYIDRALILVDTEIWAAMSNTNRAGLIGHEALYFMMRAYAQDTDSRYARKVTGHLFSEFEFENIFDGIDFKTAAACTTYEAGPRDTKDTSFFVYREKDSWIFQFREIGGRPVVSKETFSLGDIFWDGFPLTPPSEKAGPVGYMVESKSKFNKGGGFVLSWGDFGDGKAGVYIAAITQDDPGGRDQKRFKCFKMGEPEQVTHPPSR